MIFTLNIFTGEKKALFFKGCWQQCFLFVCFIFVVVSINHIQLQGGGGCFFVDIPHWYCRGRHKTTLDQFQPQARCSSPQHWQRSNGEGPECFHMCSSHKLFLCLQCHIQMCENNRKWHNLGSWIYWNTVAELMYVNPVVWPQIKPPPVQAEPKGSSIIS